jgi:hypothetical protein
VPAAFRESVAYAEQNLYARAAQLIGDKDARQHEFSVQLRAFDASKSGAKLGVSILVAMCTALLKKTTRGGLIIIGEINLGGSIEPVHNAVTVAEIAVEKGAKPGKDSANHPVETAFSMVDFEATDFRHRWRKEAITQFTRRESSRLPLALTPTRISPGMPALIVAREWSLQRLWKTAESRTLEEGQSLWNFGVRKIAYPVASLGRSVLALEQN